MRKTAIIMLAAILFGSLISGCAALSDESGKSYRAALEKYDEGFYDDAVALFLRAVSQGDRSAVLQADLALAYLKAGSNEKAEKALSDALKEGNEDRAVYYRAGLYHRECGDYEQAETYFRRAVPSDTEKAKAEDLPVYGYLAEAKRMNGKPEEAISIYQLLITKGYYPVEHKLLIGECYLDAHQISAASTYFDWAEQDGLKPEQYLYLYRLLQKAEAYTRAEVLFRKGLDRLKAEKKPSMSIGEYYANAGKYAAAGNYLTDETSFGAEMTKAYFEVENGDYDAAEKRYQELLKRGENKTEIYVQYFILAARSSKFDMAAQILTELRSYHDSSIAAVIDWNEIILYELKLDYAAAYEKLAAYMSVYGVTDVCEREKLFLSRALKR